MSVKLLTEHHLEILSLKRGCTGSSEPTLVKMPHCWKSHVRAQLYCNIKPEDVATVRSRELLTKFELEDLDPILRERQLHWFGHVECSSGAVRTACDIQVDGW